MDSQQPTQGAPAWMDLLLNRLNDFNMPGDLFDQTIHDNCERRGHFENGEFVYSFSSRCCGDRRSCGRAPRRGPGRR